MSGCFFWNTVYVVMYYQIACLWNQFAKNWIESVTSNCTLRELNRIMFESRWCNSNQEIVESRFWLYPSMMPVHAIHNRSFQRRGFPRNLKKSCKVCASLHMSTHVRLQWFNVNCTSLINDWLVHLIIQFLHCTSLAKLHPIVTNPHFTRLVQKSVVFQDKITSFFQTFQGTLFIFMLTKTLQNWFLNGKISYRMYYSILNTEWDSNFWTLNFRCFVSWTARKLTHAWVINSVIDICIFQVSITVFKDFSRLFHVYDHFQDLSRPWKFLH